MSLKWEARGRSLRISWCASGADWRGSARAWVAAKQFARAAPAHFRRIGPLAFVESPWVEGTTLRDAIETGISPVRGIEVLCQGIEELVPLLDRNPAVCHGDLSPANLVLAKDGGVAWIDWETAKVNEGTGSAPEWIVAKPAYLAPERARTGYLSPATEIFALGAIAFELISGAPLFAQDKTGFAAALAFGPQAWAETCAVLPRAWRNPVARAVHPLPNFRHATAAELAIELERALAER